MEYKDKLKKFFDYIEDPLKFCTLLRSPYDPSQEFEPYEYQRDIIVRKDEPKIALRFGRQVGKSVTLVAIMTRFAMVKPHQSIVVIAPRANHIDAIWTNFNRMVLDSDLKKWIKGVRRGQPHKITFKNDSYILGIIAGDTGESVKGQRGNLLVLDECLTSDAEIYTESGKKQLKDLRIGEKVLTITTRKDVEDEIFNGSLEITKTLRDDNLPGIRSNMPFQRISPLHYTPIENINYVGKKEFYYLRTETGRTIKITPDHMVLSRDGKFIPVINATELAIPLQARRAYVSGENEPQDERALLASIFGVLRSGKLPEDRREFLNVLDNLEIPPPELFPVLDDDEEFVKYAVYNPIKEVPDWVFQSKRYAGEFLGGYISCCNKIPNDEYVLKALEWFPEMKIVDGTIMPESIHYFAENIGYRFNNQSNTILGIVNEYLKTHPSQDNLDEWVSERVEQFFLFEKIIHKIPISTMDAYGIKTKNGMFLANGFIVHNCDFLADKAWAEILPILTSDPNAKLLLASTPSGKRGHFWRVFNDPTLGFYTKHVPSFMAPHWTAEHDRLYRGMLAPEEYTHQVEGEFGDLQSGVFSQDNVSDSFIAADYPVLNKHTKGLTVMGVDWNGKGLGTIIVVLRRIETPLKAPYWKVGNNLNIEQSHKELKNGFVVIHREIYNATDDKHNLGSVQRVAEIVRKLKVDALYGDYGYGHTNWELIHTMGEKYENDILKYAYGIQMGRGFTFIDPVLDIEISKNAKNLGIFLLSQLILGKKLGISYIDDELNMRSPYYVAEGKDDAMRTIGYELRNYYVDNWTTDGQPIYCKENDHFIAAIISALIGYTVDFDPQFKHAGVEAFMGGDSFNAVVRDRLQASSVLRNRYENTPDKLLEELGVPLKKDKEYHNTFVITHKPIRRELDEEDSSRHRSRNNGSILPRDF